MKYTQNRSRTAQENIIKAARKLIAANGFENTTTEEIAKKAGVSKASVFAHFGDKSNLLIAVGIAKMERLNELNKQGSLIEFYTPWFEFLAKNKDFSNLYFNQSSLPKGRWTSQFLRSCNDQENVVAQIIQRLEPSKLGNPHPVGFYARGAQAFFYQTVIYRNAGWLKNDSEALLALENSLTVWLAD